MPRPRKPCAKCGGDKGPSPRGGHIYCPACRELLDWQSHRRASARAVRDRKPCERCGGRKPPGRAVRFCIACQEQAQTKCSRCQTNTPRDSGKRLCEACLALAKGEKRARQAEWRRKKLLDPAIRAAQNAANAKRRKKHRAEDPAVVTAARELSRIQYRLTAEEPVRPVDDQEYDANAKDEKLGLRYGVRIPSLPLGLKVRELGEREVFDNPWAPLSVHDPDMGLKRACERAGLQERSVFAWCNGERPFVNLYKAIDVLDRLDLCWWEVWTEETVRRPVLTGRVYAWKMRGTTRVSHGVVRVACYGDRHDLDGGGHDAWSLERTRRLFEATSDREFKAAAKMEPPTPLVEVGCELCLDDVEALRLMSIEERLAWTPAPRERSSGAVLELAVA